jgi:hypothetical protein
MTFKRLAGRIAGSCLSALIILMISGLLGEAALRLYNHFNPVFIFHDDSYNRFRGKPFSEDWDFTLNSGGFKDLEFSEKRGYRILGIGDSFAYGIVPYRHNYLTLLEGRLQDIRPATEVLNLGIPRLGPKDYLDLLVREGLPLRPDMVLLSFFIGNDFVRPRPRPWYSHSHVLSLLHYAFAIRPRLEGRIIHGKGDYCDDCAAMEPDAFLQVERERSGIYLEHLDGFDGLLNTAMSPLVRIRDICRERGIDFLVVLIPDEMQVDPALREEIRQRFFPGLSPSEWNNTRPNARLGLRLQAEGIDYFDLYPAFAEEAKHRRLYRLRDTHWNIAGNRLAADLIGARIGRGWPAGSGGLSGRMPY